MNCCGGSSKMSEPCSMVPVEPYRDNRQISKTSLYFIRNANVADEIQIQTSCWMISEVAFCKLSTTKALANQSAHWFVGAASLKYVVDGRACSRGPSTPTMDAIQKTNLSHACACNGGRKTSRSQLTFRSQLYPWRRLWKRPAAFLLSLMYILPCEGLNIQRLGSQQIPSFYRVFRGFEGQIVIDLDEEVHVILFGPPLSCRGCICVAFKWLHDVGGWGRLAGLDCL